MNPLKANQVLPQQRAEYTRGYSRALAETELCATPSGATRDDAAMGEVPG
jgi:hypothetical protein